MRYFIITAQAPKGKANLFGHYLLNQQFKAGLKSLITFACDDKAPSKDSIINNKSLIAQAVHFTRGVGHKLRMKGGSLSQLL